MKKTTILRAAAVTAAAALLVLVGAVGGASLRGESEKGYKRSMATYGAADGIMMNYASTEESAMDGSAAAAKQTDRKIVRTAQLDVKTKVLDDALASIRLRVEQAAGTVEYCEISGQKGEDRYAFLEVRVPQEQLDVCLAEAGALGEVTRQIMQQSDMTSQYMDNASRLESARAQKQRLDELYAAAQDMTDIVAITDALFDVQQEIDALTGANAFIDERAAYSRVSITLNEQKTEEESGFLTRLAGSLKAGAEAIGACFGALTLAAAWALPWLALIAAGAGVVWVIRKRRR